jgi:hypothetical protein
MQAFFNHYESIVFAVSAHHSRDDGGASLKMNRASYNDICVGRYDNTIVKSIRGLTIFFLKYLYSVYIIHTEHMFVHL